MLPDPDPAAAVLWCGVVVGRLIRRLCGCWCVRLRSFFARQEADAALSARIGALETSPAPSQPASHEESGRLLLSGTPVQIANGQAGYDITFARPFAAPPHVLVSVGKPGDPSGTLRASTGVPTTTGCRIWVAGAVATAWVEWVAKE